MADVELIVNDKTYSGWSDISITKSLEAVAGSFSLSAINKNGLDLLPGYSCAIKLNGSTVITGYIDSVNYSISTNNQILQIIGRDKTGDLVDSSASNTTGEFLNITLKELIDNIIKPFGIKAIYNAKMPSLRSKVSLQQDSAFDVIDRETRKAGLFAFPDGLGNLIIDKIGSKQATSSLQLGVNVLSFNSKIDFTDRFSEYIVKGQSSSTDDSVPEEDIAIVATAKDLNIERFRPLIVLAETEVTTAQAITRANWEAAVRLARSEEISVTTQGWKQEDGSLWDINSIVNIDISSIKYKAPKLIKSVNYVLDTNGGTITNLILVEENSYLPQNEIKKKKKGDYVGPIVIDPTLNNFEYQL